MAIPTLLRKTDFPTIDFSTGARSLKAYLAIKDAVVRFGWNLEFEINNSDQDMQAVFSNAGSGYMFKLSITTATSDIFIESAQSWTDINSPVNKLIEHGISIPNINFTDGDIAIVGDNQRFYLFMTSSTKSTSNDAKTAFVGDIVTFKDTDPFSFAVITNERVLVDRTASSSANERGRLYAGLSSLSSSTNTAGLYLFGLQDGTLEPGGRQCALFTPGESPLTQLIINIEFMESSQPILLTPTYVYHANFSEVINGTAIANHGRGIVPGFSISLTPAKKIMESDTFEIITIAGQNCIVLPSIAASTYQSAVLVLSDWSNLI